MYFIEQMSHVAAASHAPFIASASPELLGLDSFADLGRPRDLAKVFDTVEYTKWRSFRDSEDSRYVGLTMPRFLGRLPYDPKEGTSVEGFNFVEDVDGTDHSKSVSYTHLNCATTTGWSMSPSRNSTSTSVPWRGTVSYTHLDVYKRQRQDAARQGGAHLERVGPRTPGEPGQRDRAGFLVGLQEEPAQGRLRCV